MDEAHRLNLAWPLAGVDAESWVTTNYVDLDFGPSLRDYTGNTGDLAKTYDGHLGVDIGISSFRSMDAGVPVRAAASGTVTYVVDAFEDRHIACEDSNANVVSVQHASGHVLHYVHLRTDSVPVEIGDVVQAGDRLGLVGSSGCSDAPHLHFEITTAFGETIDPFLDNLWCNPPVYDTPLNWMEGWLLVGPAEQYTNPSQDPPTETSSWTQGETLLAYAVVAGGLPGEEVAVLLTGPDGSTLGPWPIRFEQSWQLSAWNWAFTLKGVAGDWTAQYQLNGTVVAEKPFRLE